MGKFQDGHAYKTFTFFYTIFFQLFNKDSLRCLFWFCFAVTFGITTAVIIGMAVFLISFFLIYKRVSCIKNKGISASLQPVKEDSAYEEIQERLQTPGNAVDSIYVTAGMHTDVTSLHYSTIDFQSHSQEAGGEEVNPSTSACEYSTVDFRKRPDNSSVTQASRPAEENLYSAVNELEQI